MRTSNLKKVFATNDEHTIAMNVNMKGFQNKNLWPLMALEEDWERNLFENLFDWCF